MVREIIFAWIYEWNRRFDNFFVLKSNPYEAIGKKLKESYIKSLKILKNEKKVLNYVGWASASNV